MEVMVVGCLAAAAVACMAAAAALLLIIMAAALVLAAVQTIQATVVMAAEALNQVMDIYY
ncbi:MAG TPA: hypothetical protein VLO13_03155 [Halomonas sp.]|nr:hypothetical protein [Halomonas sp.]